jgi:hypothetical protein
MIFSLFEPKNIAFQTKKGRGVGFFLDFLRFFINVQPHDSAVAILNFLVSLRGCDDNGFSALGRTKFL